MKSRIAMLAAAIVAAPLFVWPLLSSQDYQSQWERERRIFDEGRNHGLNGDPRELSPPYTGRDLEAWREGYRCGEGELFIRYREGRAK